MTTCLLRKHTTVVVAVLLTIVSIVLGGSQVRAQEKGDSAPSLQQAGTTINGTPLTITVQDGLAMEVSYNGAIQFFGDDAGGTFVEVNGIVYGEDPPAGGSFDPIPLTPVSNTGPTGAGTEANPFKIVAVARAGDSGVVVTQTITYVNGAVRYRNDFTITNTGGSEVPVRLFHGADLYLNFPGNSADFGYGFYDRDTGAVGALSQDRRSLQVFIPITPATNFQEAFYAAFWQRIGGSGGQTGPGFNNTIDTSFHDVAAGLQWNRTLAANASVSISHFGAFGLATDIGITPPPPTAPIADAPSVADPAFVTVVQKPAPNTTAAPGNIVTYSVIATNRGEGPAGNTVITMPYDASEVAVLDASFSREGGWVSEVTTSTVTLQTGRLASGSDVITGTIRFLVLPSASTGLDLGERLSFTWSDGTGGGSSFSNRTFVATGESDVDLEFYQLAASATSAPAGAALSFSSAIFAPKEPVGVWYNTPDGAAVGEPTFIAEEDGSLAIDFDTTGLPAGTYSIVFHGKWTDFTGVATFTIE